MFKTKLRIEKIDGTSTKWILIDELVYRRRKGPDKNRLFTVPAGFETDLSTMWVRGRHDRAAVLHDYVLDKYHWSFREANKLMVEAMQADNVRKWHMTIIRIGIGLKGIWEDGIKRRNHSDY